jgi:hypothetical protein
MRIRVDDPNLTGDLARYLERCDFEIRELGPNILEVAPIRSVTDPAHLRIEVLAFLRVWRAMNGDAAASVVAG